MIGLLIFVLIAVLIVAAAFGRIDWFPAAIGVVALLVLLYLLGGAEAVDLGR
jgi:hypothetical protein